MPNSNLYQIYVKFYNTVIFLYTYVTIKSMKPFCEVIVSDILPALRALTTQELAQTYELNQTEISKRLGITQPAVSQYVKELRGHKVKLLTSNGKVMQAVRSLAEEVAHGEINGMRVHEKICEICKTVREEGLICKIHGESYPLIMPCKICFKE